MEIEHKADITIDIEAVCNECGSDLDITSSGTQRNGDPKLFIEPCQKCLEKAREEERENA